MPTTKKTTPKRAGKTQRLDETPSSPVIDEVKIINANHPHAGEHVIITNETLSTGQRIARLTDCQHGTAQCGVSSADVDVPFSKPGKSEAVKNKGGRPTKFSKELAFDICEGIVEGKSLRIILSQEGMPSIATVFRWLDENEWFRDNYTRAKDNQADTNAEDIQELVADVRSGKIDPQSARVAGDLLKWSSSKLKPKKYGDKLDLTSDGKQMPAPIISIAAVPQQEKLND